MIANFLFKRTQVVLLFLSIWICLTFIISTGPNIQIFLLSLLTSDVPSIYGSAFQSNFVEFPSLSVWVGSAFGWQFLAMSFIVAWFSKERSDSRSILWSVSLSSAAVITLFDIAVGAHHDALTAKFVFENVFSNIIGSVFIAALVVAIFSSADFVKSYFPVSAIARDVLAKVTIAAGGLLYCCVAYYASALFYAPLPERFDILFSGPSSGSFKKLDASSSALEKGAGRFEFLPNSIVRSSLKWVSPHGSVVAIGSFAEGRSIHAKIYPVSNCFRAEDVRNLKISHKPLIVESGVSSFEFKSDKGSSDFFTVFEMGERSVVKLNTGPMVSFSLESDSIDQAYKITQFVAESSTVSYLGNQELMFVFGLPLISIDQKDATLSARSLMFRLGENEKEIVFLPPESVKLGEPIGSCEVLSEIGGQDDVPSGIVKVRSSGIYAGLLVVATRPQGMKNFSISGSELVISGSDGWIELGNLHGDDLNNAVLGRVSMVQVRGNISELYLDNVSQSARNVETYFALGDFQVQFVQGRIRVSGQASRIWKDGARLNSTKWEKIEFEYKGVLGGLFLAVVALFSRIVLRNLGVNKKFSWLA